MMDEQTIREFEEFINRSDAERDEFERKAKEQGLTQAQIQEYNQTRTSALVKQGRALFAKHGFCSPFEGLAERSGEMVPEVDPDKMEAAWRDGFRTFGMSGVRPLLAGTDEAWAVRYRCSQLQLIEGIDLAKLPEGSPDFSALTKDGRITDRAVRVFARFPLRKAILGVNAAMPFDLEAFIEEVRKASN